MHQVYQSASAPGTHLWGVRKAEIPVAWPMVEELIANACNNSGLYWPLEIKKELEAGNHQLWVAWARDRIRACLVTTLEASQRAAWLRGILCSGEDPDDWMEHLETIEQWALAQGCSMIHLMGRPGFERWLKPMGYRKTHTLMEKRLIND